MKLIHDESTDTVVVNFGNEDSNRVYGKTLYSDPSKALGAQFSLVFDDKMVLTQAKFLEASKHFPKDYKLELIYDREVDALSVNFYDSSIKRPYGTTYLLDPSELDGAQINLDFDANGVVMGIEVIDASINFPIEELEDK